MGVPAGRAGASATLSAWAFGPGASDAVGRPGHELANLALCGRLAAEGALLREESRGAHFRTDFPEPLEAWRRHTVFSSNA